MGSAGECVSLCGKNLFVEFTAQQFLCKGTCSPRRRENKKVGEIRDVKDSTVAHSLPRTGGSELVYISVAGTVINNSLPLSLFPDSSFLPPGSETKKATFCTLRLGTGWTSSALLWTPPGPRQSTSSTNSTSCRRGNRRTAARWWAPPTSCSRATSPPASAASPSSSRSSHPTSGATSSRVCTTTTSSVSRGSRTNTGN